MWPCQRLAQLSPCVFRYFIGNGTCPCILTGGRFGYGVVVRLHTDRDSLSGETHLPGPTVAVEKSRGFVRIRFPAAGGSGSGNRAERLSAGVFPGLFFYIGYHFPVGFVNPVVPERFEVGLGDRYGGVSHRLGDDAGMYFAVVGHGSPCMPYRVGADGCRAAEPFPERGELPVETPQRTLVFTVSLLAPFRTGEERQQIRRFLPFIRQGVDELQGLRCQYYGESSARLASPVP